MTGGARALAQRRCACGGLTGPGGGECAQCRARRQAVQRAATGGGPRLATPAVHAVLRSPGRPLDLARRAFFEARLGHDLGQVRLHTDQRAAASARTVQARAYTVGRDVVFGAGAYEPHTWRGQRLLAHELAHVVQQRGAGPVPGRLEVAPARGALERAADRAADAVMAGRPRGPALAPGRAGRAVVQRQPAPSPETLCPAQGQQISYAAGTCNPRDPQSCLLYEDWIATFSGLRTFPSADRVRDTGPRTAFAVLGSGPATASDPAPRHLRPRYLDRFVHHPTQRWVDLCLPAHLRSTAYALPSDCADIAVILRHVWLSAHRRTETLGGFVVGSAAGGAEVERARQAIVGIGSINAASIVNAYVDDAGRPLRSFAALQSRLHPGDVLVWEHHHGGDPAGRRRGGHVHTIAALTRVGDVVTGIRVLQGNEPLPSSNQEFMDQVRAQARSDRVPEPSVYEVHHAPGRRIEADVLSGSALGDVTVRPPGRADAAAAGTQVWHWRSGTTLVAAGPPSGVRRPAAPAARRGQPAQPRVLAWATPLGSASLDRLPIVLEAALADLRADIEGGIDVTEATATRLGEAAGRRLWALARRAGGFGHTAHFQPLRRIEQLIDAYGGIGRAVPRTNPNTARVVARFTTMREAFTRAARGLDDIAFPATSRGTLRILVTGFDPFVFGGTPGPEMWNPSGAAALALDGQVLRDGRLTVAVQAAVLPVSFAAFRTGIVERLVRDAGTVDGIVTVSMDADIASREQVRLEQFVIGTHRLESGTRESIPAGPGATPSSRAVLEATDAPAVAAAMGTTRAPGGSQPRALVGTATTLQFSTIAEADAALAALGAPGQGRAQPIISDASVLRRLASVARLSGGPGGRVAFTLGTPPRTFSFVLVSGPGGSFLSNEVSYRVLRARAGGAESFHVHVPGGPDVPRNARTPAARQAVAEATAVRGAVIANVRRAVIELARIAAARRP